MEQKKLNVYEMREKKLFCWKGVHTKCFNMNMEYPTITP